jgi:DNA processing protein
VAGSRLPKRIADESGLTIHAVRAALVALEVSGLVGSDSSGWFRTVRKGA